ncbi:hypothetical protein EMPS_04267 [Entomortierella parvispora]|uniref:Uncharacterized protein n=1 Tax=Entomortierella parvispora TaxID=205924 RepID=A0A9P3H891_9FUNG|nr:hypothetical protein EMPS_04267 [Entomortierella parvispora]
MPGPVYSVWTSEGFLLTPAGTDEDLFVHPFNTIFNLKYPLAYSLAYSSAKPSIAGYRVWTMQELTAKYLRKLQIFRESIIGRKVYQLSIVEPPNLDHSDMRNRYEAIRQATYGVHPDTAWPKLTRKSYVSYYPFDLQDDETAVLVYHLGGSTFGVSVTLWDYGIPEYLSSIHDENFGGQDFNQRLVNHLVLVHKKRTSRDLSRDNKFMIQLGREVEKAKQLLSSQNAVRVEIDVSSSSSPAFGDQHNFSKLLTRSQFEDLNKDLFEKTIAAVDRVVIRVFEGQRALTKENMFLGQLELLRIAPAPRGVPQIRVRMEAGYCGNILHLTVIDLATRQTVMKSFSPRSTYNTDEPNVKVERTNPFKYMDSAIWKFAEIVGTKTLLDPA